MKNTDKKAVTKESPIHPGAQVTFKNLPEPIMTVVTVAWSRNLAVCRYYDPIAEVNIPLECDPDSLAPFVPPQSCQK